MTSYLTKLRNSLNNMSEPTVEDTLHDLVDEYVGKHPYAKHLTEQLNIELSDPKARTENYELFMEWVSEKAEKYDY